MHRPNLKVEPFFRFVLAKLEKYDALDAMSLMSDFFAFEARYSQYKFLVDGHCISETHSSFFLPGIFLKYKYHSLNLIIEYFYSNIIL